MTSLDYCIKCLVKNRNANSRLFIRLIQFVSFPIYCNARILCKRVWYIIQYYTRVKYCKNCVSWRSPPAANFVVQSHNIPAHENKSLAMSFNIYIYVCVQPKPLIHYTPCTPSVAFRSIRSVYVPYNILYITMSMRPRTNRRRLLYLAAGQNAVPMVFVVYKYHI